TLLHREQIVRIEFEISNGKLRNRLNLQARAIAIVPGLPGMDLQPDRQLDLRHALQILAKNRALDLELVFIPSVLVMTSSAALKVRTPRIHSLRGRLKNPGQFGPGELLFFFSELRFYLFALQHERHENRFSPSLLICGKASQSFAAIH